MSAYSKLKRQTQAFVDEYVRLGVGTDAARISHPDYKRPEAVAFKLLHHHKVKAAIQERTEDAIAKAGVRVVRVLEEAAQNAFFNIKDLYDAEGNRIPIYKLPHSVASAICSEEYDENGNVRKYRTNSKNEALKLLMQYLKILVDKHEVKADISMQDVSPIEKARRIAFLLEQGIQAQITAQPMVDDFDDEDDLDDDGELETPESGG